MLFYQFIEKKKGTPDNSNTTTPKNLEKILSVHWLVVKIDKNCQVIFEFGKRV
ncbi:MAG: hypothetical protein LBC20_12125 [Planctomycetaceae bacterium]|jgi:hypothetical protein|nr:hypothetical protein [Planctomycetaceae bacterium]